MTSETIPGVRDKATLRAEALARRDALPEDYRATAALRIGAQARPVLEALRPRSVAGYWPMRSEADPRPVLALARALGAEIALPVTRPDRLLFRIWGEGAPLVASVFGTSCPPEDAAEIVPDLLLMPLAAFDRRGARIGYGKAYYDRAIAAFHAAGHFPHLLGIAFAAQEVAEVPEEPHDVPLHFVATDERLLTVPPRLPEPLN